MSFRNPFRSFTLLAGVLLVTLGLMSAIVDKLTRSPSAIDTVAFPVTEPEPMPALMALPPIRLPEPASPLQQEQRALVKYLSATYRQPETVVRRIVKTAYVEAERHELSPLLVLAIVMKESSLRPDAKSSYGALGLMQVVPRFHMDKLPKTKNPAEVLLKPEENIKVGAAILAEYLDWKKGSLPDALVKYSGNAKGYTKKVKQFESELESVRAQATQLASLS